MRVSTLLLPSIVFLGFLCGCKSTGGRSSGTAATGPTDSGITGVWDPKNGLFLDTPKADMMAPLPKIGGVPMSQALSSASQVQLGLAADLQNSAGIESLMVSCAKGDQEVTSDKWSAYVSLQADGTTIKEMTQPLKSCGQIQLKINNLTATQRYVIQVSYFAVVDGLTLVFYKGQTKKFNPSDVNVTLVLQKNLQNQVVDVVQALGPEAQCNKSHYFWNGFGCVNSFTTMSFVYADMSDQIPTTKDQNKKMCLSINESNSMPELQPCGSINAVQRLRPELTATQTVGGYTAPWYQLKFDIANDGDTPQCLTTVFPGSQGVFNTAEIQSKKCVTRPDGLPDPKQLFTIVKDTNTNQGYFNAYKIMAPTFPEEPNVRRCISVKIRGGERLKGSTTYAAGAKIYPEKCNTTEEAVRQSQYIKFDLSP